MNILPRDLKPFATFMEILLHTFKEVVDSIASRGGQLVILGTLTFASGAMWIHQNADGPGEKMFFFFGGLFSRTFLDGDKANGKGKMPLMYDKDGDGKPDGENK